MNKFIGCFIIVIISLFSCKQKNENEAVFKKNYATSSSLKTLQHSYTNLEGKPVKLSYYKDKMIILNFWETSCKPCIKEMPSLERCKTLLEKDNFVFLLASNEPLKKIKSFKETTNFNLNFIKYTGTLSQLKINVLPTTFVFDEKGNNVYKTIGATDWSSSEMILKLKNLKNK